MICFCFRKSFFYTCQSKRTCKEERTTCIEARREDERGPREGARRRRGWKREVREVSIFLSLFLSVFFSRGASIESKKQKKEKLSKPLIKTMPSDNEEQPVDAKTIAELTEQVRDRLISISHRSLASFSPSQLSSLSGTCSFRQRDELLILYSRHPRSVGIGPRGGSVTKSTRINSDALVEEHENKKNKNSPDDTRPRAAISPVLGRARPARGPHGAGLGTAARPRGVAGSVSDRKQP